MRRRGIELRANAHPFSFPRGDARRLACSLATFVVAGHSAVRPPWLLLLPLCLAPLLPRGRRCLTAPPAPPSEVSTGAVAHSHRATLEGECRGFRSDGYSAGGWCNRSTLDPCHNLPKKP